MNNHSVIPSEDMIIKTVENLKNNGFNPIVVDTKEQALEKLKELVPEGSQFCAGSSTTLNEIGFSSYMAENSGKYSNYGDIIKNENDEEKRRELRRKAVTADYFLGSVNAITQDGTLIAVDQTGSRVGAYLFAAKNLIIVSGVNKIVKDLESGMKRVREYVYPLEDKRLMGMYNVNSSTSKWIIFEREKTPNRVTVILIKEVLGF